MNFWFYLITNSVCKTVENILLVYLGIAMSNGGNVWFYIYIGIVAICLITAIVLKVIMIKQKQKM